jgi:tRNA (cmo5U34)-methyltransferase
VSDTTNDTQWSEQDSTTFIDLAEIFVPARREQINTLIELIPAEGDERFTMVELASGAGILAQAILERFPSCQYIALDGSEVMRQQMAQRLAVHKERLDIRPFTLEKRDWRTNLPAPIRCVVSSLSIHHIDDPGKRRLFHDMIARLERGGALLISDIIKPANSRIARLYARQYDEIVKQQSMAVRGDMSGFADFQKEKWNYFVYDYYNPETYDKPSLLSEQLRWLQEVNFSTVDCFWMRAGHAIYGGYK